MKVMTVLGTRPEIIRLSLVIEKLDRFASGHVLVNTGQNFTDSLNAMFFRDLRVRAPDYDLGVRAETFGEQIGRILTEGERVIMKERPDAVLILGDTNSGLLAMIAKRLGIPVFHMEAGNRCYDDRVPEEINRRVIDHSSTVLLPYTERSKENLVREGIARERIFVTGNPIFEVLQAYSSDIEGSHALARLGLTRERYVLVTMHRAENVDVESRLRNLLEGLRRAGTENDCPVICSLHPRTRSRIESFGLEGAGADIRFVDPLGFFDFVSLEKQALCVVSDSGTVQEECAIFGVPNVTIRDVTERPETLECGSNMLSGTEPEMVSRCVRVVLAAPRSWTPPPEYVDPIVSAKIVKILLGYRWDPSSAGASARR
jgi:UDP-N-acetylglucosamine 2-epimerase (non-hydrolysing)